MSAEKFTFDQRACFIAGQAKSGTTLVVALLDGHPELLVFPQDTAYFATALTKYGPRGRRAQFDYLTQQSWSKVLFGFEKRARKHDYSSFPRERLYQTFERLAFDPANEQRDLLVLMMEAYATVFGIPFDRVKRWVEKTPANRNYVPAIFARFPDAKLLVTMRDPRSSGCANSSGKEQEDRTVFGLSRDRALAGYGQIGAERAKRRSVRVGHSVRTIGPRALNHDAAGLQLPRDHVRSRDCPQPDQGRPFMGGKLIRRCGVFTNQHRTGHPLGARAERR